VTDIRLAIIGAGSVRCTPAVIGALATYFGERPLHIRMFDADVERLDLFDRLARLCFVTTHSTHTLLSSTDLADTIHDADRVVLQVGENCARKYLRESHRMGIANLSAAAMIEQAVEEISGLIPAEADVLSLQFEDIEIPRERHFRVDWELPEPSEAQRLAVPFQALRWIHEEEYVHEFLREHERSPLKAWLDDVTSAQEIERVAQG
jgi:hypothetical protein